MTNLRSRAQALLYRETGTKAIAQPPPDVKAAQTAQRAKQLYGDRYGPAFAAFQPRLEARYRHDAEALQQIRAAIPQLRAFGERRAMTNEAMHEMLSRVVEYSQFPRDPDTQQRIGEMTFEAIRLSRESTEKANEVVGRFNKFIGDLRTECPYVGNLATTAGARVDRQMVELGARFSEHE